MEAPKEINKLKNQNQNKRDKVPHRKLYQLRIHWINVHEIDPNLGNYSPSLLSLPQFYVDEKFYHVIIFSLFWHPPSSSPLYYSVIDEDCENKKEQSNVWLHLLWFESTMFTNFVQDNRTASTISWIWLLCSKAFTRFQKSFLPPFSLGFTLKWNNQR